MHLFFSLESESSVHFLWRHQRHSPYHCLRLWFFYPQTLRVVRYLFAMCLIMFLCFFLMFCINLWCMVIVYSISCFFSCLFCVVIFVWFCCICFSFVLCFFSFSCHVRIVFSSRSGGWTRNQPGEIRNHFFSFFSNPVWFFFVFLIFYFRHFHIEK